MTTKRKEDPAPDELAGVTTRDVSALNGGVEPEPAPAAPDKPFISAGMAHDLDTVGWATDPATGKKITKEDIEQ